MGKVGSGSINHALHDKGIHTLHAHWMQGLYPKSEFPTNKLKIIKRVKENKTPPLKVITIVREPVGRNISAFFQNMPKYCLDLQNTDVEELQDIFLNKYLIEYPDLWFKNEIMDLFNFDPFKEKFDYKKGYKIYKAGKHKILILRLEDCDRILPEAIYKLLKVKNVNMIRRNVTANKGHIVSRNKYKEFKSLTFPEEFFNKNYKLKYAKHFYTQKELETFKQGWLKYGKLD
jgi:hypothetical protein